MSSNLYNVFLVVQGILSALLVISVLLQPGVEGAGAAFGGSTGGESFRTKRGLEKFLSNATVFLALVIAVISIVILKYN